MHTIHFGSSPHTSFVSNFPARVHASTTLKLSEIRPQYADLKLQSFLLEKRNKVLKVGHYSGSGINCHEHVDWSELVCEIRHFLIEIFDAFFDLIQILLCLCLLGLQRNGSLEWAGVVDHF